jgi:hypothetical protein
MRRRITVLGGAPLVAALATLAFAASPAGGSSTGGFSRSIPSSGLTSLQGGALGPDAGIQDPEFPPGMEGGEAARATRKPITTNRSLSTERGERAEQGGSDDNHERARSNPELNLSFDGLNHRDSRLANGGNQFSLEPPDQGLCVGNGNVLETINDVMRVFDTAGNPLTTPLSLNEFYGYTPSINRTTGEFGPFVTDPSCYFDVPTQRWFHVVLTLDVDPVTGEFLGTNHLDLAVSRTASPTGAWTIYRLPVQDDGTDGTPDHGCPLDDDGTGHGPCIGDYPHIGADANGFYISTNEYAFFPTFVYMGAQIYAFSKAALAAGASNITVTQFDTSHSGVGGKPGFTIWPAESPPNQFVSRAHGTEFFLSSDAGDEAQCDSGTPCNPGTRTSRRLLTWALTNTASLNSSSPDLDLRMKAVRVGRYAVPPTSDQPGSGTVIRNRTTPPAPLGACINNTMMPTPFGPGCWQFLFVDEPAHHEVISRPDSNDSRMQQTWYANGKLWGALDTALTVNGENKAGIAYFIVDPDVQNDSIEVEIVKQGYLGLKDTNLTYPAIATTPDGRGVMAFTVVGEDTFPSAGYAGIDARVGAGDVHIAAAGVGVTDGFTSYKAFVGDPPRTRWGDYGAAALDGNSIWIGSEYINQSCTLAQYVSSPFGSCGGTRTALANWGTRISKVTP